MCACWPRIWPPRAAAVTSRRLNPAVPDSIAWGPLNGSRGNNNNNNNNNHGEGGVASSLIARF